MISLDEEIARRVELALNAPVAPLEDLEAVLLRALDPAFTATEVFGAVEGLDIAPPEERMVFTPRTGDHWKREIHTRTHGILVTDKVNKVTREVFEACKTFKGIAQNVMWPAAFYMEAGRDMRALHKEDPKRHAIDWFRTASLAPLPDFSPGNMIDDENPYRAARIKDGKRLIAIETCDRLRHREVCSALDITDEVLRNTGAESNVDHRTTVQDTLRDLALFGACTRAKDHAGTPVYIWGKPQYPE
jgi:hypothetical protein